MEKTDESEIFRKFQAHCDVDPKRELYSVYRHLCGYAHPSTTGAFAFIEPTTKVPGLRTEPRTSPSAVEDRRHVPHPGGARLRFCRESADAR
ncbi:hypothetical protein ACIHAR_37580 [Streptomyces sp. NPDC052016]|uniref:hypothetical protein n=1 Tax=Streptomyces sp. NPDC052016 TaxID=3365680 RepID=UPI0037D5DFCB